ncbi:MAG: RlmE family RNA methyltransferase [Gammaproteobacteria bacterium AqS3]|nr:RlmE family RNA methyltransferase [Gammaproteobacteria bacterium AqS3]
MARSRGKSSSSQRWRARQARDGYARRAREQGLRSRAVFKLEQINHRHRLLRPGMTVLDLGAAPGGWSRAARQIVGDSGRVLAVDILPMEALAGVEFIRGDIADAEVRSALDARLGGAQIDALICDMAPNLSGVRTLDQARADALLELTRQTAGRHLRPGGSLLVKLFIGPGWEHQLAALRDEFASVHLFKPEASRAASRETYAVCLGMGSEPAG